MILSTAISLGQKSIRRSLRRPGVFVRFLQVQSSSQAFLEKLESSPGITCLSLNRPQSKNAISTTLLQVSFFIEDCTSGIEKTSLQQMRECLEQVHYDKR